ncbi:BREX-4 system phosphatase PglZ [Clostridium vitabionis]|uniref:BREX-4 system phosphatase PglZ n=1 Tax=Clostridium vitabionis TaxID=2784388 RepID=UPI00188A59A4|nr:BREX-4 system phosphatase PglZ [Clostridium vitabionis]
MNYEECIKKAKRFLMKDDYQPLIVDVQNGDDLSRLLTELCPITSTTSEVIPASNYCSRDGFPKIEDLLHDLQTKDHNCFVTGLSSYLRLIGEENLTSRLSEIINMSTNGHVVIFTYQCRQFLNIRDPRLERRIALLEGNVTQIPDIFFCSSNLPLPEKLKVASGLENFAVAVEQAVEPKVYLVTNKTKEQFPYALYNITNLNKAYDVLALKDPLTKNLSESMGTEMEWNYALTLVNENSNWANAIDSTFGDHRRLDIFVSSIQDMQLNYNRLWLYYIALKLYSVKNNWCLNYAAAHASTIKEMASNIYRGILSKSPSDNDFWECYSSRKILLNQIGNPSAELVSYCKIAHAKEAEEIYYLTDNTEKEKEEIFAYLNRYGTKENREELTNILEKIYPELAAYLKPYDFQVDLLNHYFSEYKYQKVVNKIFPDFYDLVLEQAKKRDYISILQPRSAVVENLSKPNALLYFMDAMGVEYLGYIQSVCNDLKLKIKIKVCRSELPSITECNREFVEGWPEDHIVNIKDIDEVKHQGKNNYDYYKHSKLPIHLIKELEIIRDVLGKIKAKLLNGDIAEAVMIADHGASRLVILHDRENVYEMAEKGIHSGRCCKKSELDEKPEYAVDAGDYWVLANYDRFKGSRKIGVETHGGATLEEICVPLITLTYSDKSIEVYIMPVDSHLDDINTIPQIEVSFRKKAAIKIFLTEEQQDVSVRINQKKYSADPMGNGYYRVDMPDIKKKGTYYVDVYSGDNRIAEKLPLIVEREGQKVNDLL